MSMNVVISTRALAIGTAVLALLMVIGGGGHSLAVTSVRLRAGMPYDFRFVGLLAIGWTLLFAGLTYFGLVRSIDVGHRWAFAWAAATGVGLSVFCVILMPLAAAREAAIPTLVLNAAFLVWLAMVWRQVATP